MNPDTLSALETSILKRDWKGGEVKCVRERETRTCTYTMFFNVQMTEYSEDKDDFEDITGNKVHF